ncbi:DUF943 family protein [Paramixta manurensis]|uniref:DUF943 family protein n=1 Tax=Paramixta manurensis TaxID=2740817 RepID=A0A6M8U8Q1_9GAMM|nr:DUF943 family protein [Erwiniaceae bacterium PD-1]
MKIKSKIMRYIFTLVGCVLLGYLLWLSLRPVEIIAVHQRNNYSDVLVKNFPLTDKGRIEWWLKNKDRLNHRYDIPKPASYGDFTINFWLFGKGYQKEGKDDRLCFSDIKTEANCIDKNLLFAINKSQNFGVRFISYDGDDYQLGKNGEIIKINRK